jgi:hypothetical protein
MIEKVQDGCWWVWEVTVLADRTWRKAVMRTEVR